MLVSVSCITDSYSYPKVIRRHLKKLLEWFIEKDEYTAQELFHGINNEFLEANNSSNIGNFEYNKYRLGLLSLRQAFLEIYLFEEYPEFYL